MLCVNNSPFCWLSVGTCGLQAMGNQFAVLILMDITVSFDITFQLSVPGSDAAHLYCLLSAQVNSLTELGIPAMKNCCCKTRAEKSAGSNDSTRVRTCLPSVPVEGAALGWAHQIGLLFAARIHSVG
jgi:hypothetical protein